MDDWVCDSLIAASVGTLAVFVLRKLLYSWVLEPIAQKFDKAVEPDSKDKFMFGAWCLFIHSLGLLALLGFLTDRGELFGLFMPSSQEDPSLWVPSHSDLTLSQAQVWVISLEIGFYLVEMLYLALDPPPDAIEKIAHHITALGLIIVSLLTGHQQIGIYIMVMHKVIEPFLFSAKAAHYAGAETLSSILFALFVVIWLPTRLYVFPYWIYKILWAPGINFSESMFYFSATFLVALFGLHVYWTALIFRAIYAMVVGGKLKSELDPGYKKTSKKD